MGPLFGHLNGTLGKTCFCFLCSFPGHLLCSICCQILGCLGFPKPGFCNRGVATSSTLSRVWGRQQRCALLPPFEELNHRAHMPNTQPHPLAARVNKSRSDGQCQAKPSQVRSQRVSELHVRTCEDTDSPFTLSPCMGAWAAGPVHGATHAPCTRLAPATEHRSSRCVTGKEVEQRPQLFVGHVSSQARLCRTTLTHEQPSRPL